MRILFGFGLVSLAAAPVHMAGAQHPMVLAKLQEMNAQAPQPPMDQIKAAVAQTVKAFGEANGVCVPKEVVLGEVAPVTGSREVLQAVLSGQLRNGWSVYAVHSGCAGTEPFRYLVVQKSDFSLLALQVNEGKTYTSPSIMRDTSAQAALGALQKARSLDAKCTGEDMKMGPTRVSAQSTDLGSEIFGARYAGSWTEVWQFQTCGKKLDVTVHFTPDGDGGAYSNVKADEVAVVN